VRRRPAPHAYLEKAPFPAGWWQCPAKFLFFSSPCCPGSWSPGADVVRVVRSPDLLRRVSGFPPVRRAVRAVSCGRGAGIEGFARRGAHGPGLGVLA